MPFDQARLCPCGVDMDPPSLVHLGGCLTPGVSVEHGIQPLYDNDAVGRFDDDGLWRGVFKGMVKRGGIDDRGIVAQARDEIDVGRCVERPVTPTPVVRTLGIIHGVELGAGEVPPIEPDEDCVGLRGVGLKACVERVDETGGKGGFPGCRHACDGDQETGCVGDAVRALVYIF